MEEICLHRSGRLVLASGPNRSPMSSKIHAVLTSALTFFERKFDYAAGPGNNMDIIDRKLYSAGPVPNTLVFPLGLRQRVAGMLSDSGCAIQHKGGSLLSEFVGKPAEQIDWDGLFREFKIYPDQQEMLTKITASDGGVVTAPTGAGKAQPMWSEIMTPVGPIKMSEVRVGMEICHPDGGTTRIVAIHPQGVVPVYRVKFDGGQHVDCCGNHLWSIRARGKKTRPVLRTTDWMRERISRKGGTDLYIKTAKPVYFEAKDVPIPPYTLGVLLGDGTLTQAVVKWCKPDQSIAYEIAKELPASLKISSTEDDHIIVAAEGCRSRYRPDLGDEDWHVYRRQLRAMGLMGLGSLEKFIPDNYLINSEQVRWDVLRGLLDTDGSVSKSGRVTEFSTSSSRLADDFQFLVTSLGGTVHRVLRKTTHADSHRFVVKFDDQSAAFKVDTKKKKLKTRTTYDQTIWKIRQIEHIGDFEAQCITVEAADGMYLTDNCVPTHNSVCLRMLCRMYSQAKIHVVTKSATLADEIFTDLSSVVPDAGMFGAGKKNLRRVTVFVADSLHHGMGDADIVIPDEVHELVAPKYAALLARYKKARIFGLSASPTGRSDNRDILTEAICGPVIHEMSYQEAVDAGRVVPITVEWLRMPQGPDTSSIKNLATKDRHALWHNNVRNSIIAQRATKFGPEEQVMIMVKTIDHAVHLKRFLPDYTLAYAANGMDSDRLKGYIKQGLLPHDEPLMTHERLRSLRKEFAEGKLKKVISNYVWSTGVNFRELAVLIRADAASSEIRDVQIPGRVCRRIPGQKESALLIDCWDEWDSRLLRKSQSRSRNYRKKGWTQIYANQDQSGQVLP